MKTHLELSTYAGQSAHLIKQLDACNSGQADRAAEILHRASHDHTRKRISDMQMSHAIMAAAEVLRGFEDTAFAGGFNCGSAAGSASLTHS